MKEATQSVAGDASDVLPRLEAQGSGLKDGNSYSDRASFVTYEGQWLNR